MRKNEKIYQEKRKGRRLKKSSNIFYISGHEEENKTFSSAVESREISTSSYIKKISLDNLLIAYLNSKTDKIGNLIKNYSNIFTNNSLNHMFIKSHLVSQPNNILR